MKNASYVPSKKKYMMKKLDVISNDENRNTGGIINLKNFKEYLGMSPDGSTLSLQNCKFLYF